VRERIGKQRNNRENNNCPVMQQSGEENITYIITGLGHFGRGLGCSSTRSFVHLPARSLARSLAASSVRPIVWSAETSTGRRKTQKETDREEIEQVSFSSWLSSGLFFYVRILRTVSSRSNHQPSTASRQQEWLAARRLTISSRIVDALANASAHRKR
jgi:hypothetical protein